MAQREYRFFVYILASKSRVLYTGVTNDLAVRVFQHKIGRFPGFTKRNHIHRLVYFESFQYVRDAIAREKEIKHWTRERRVQLIESINPTWEDLAESWFSADELANAHLPVNVKYSAATVQNFSSGRCEHEMRKPDPEVPVTVQYRKSLRRTFGSGK